MSGNFQYSTQQFIDAIPGTGGIITKIAAKVGCTWFTCKRYIEKFPKVKEAYEAECERVLDLAESKLIKHIEKGQAWAIKYILSTKGRKRGYSERFEVTGADSGPIIIKYTGNIDPEDI